MSDKYCFKGMSFKRNVVRLQNSNKKNKKREERGESLKGGTIIGNSLS